MIRWLVRSAILYALICISFVVHAENSQRKRITLGLVTFPPLVLEGDGYSPCTGPAIEMTKNVLESQGFAIDVVCAPAARLTSLIKQGAIDLTVTIKSHEALQGVVTFHDVPFVKLKLVLFSNPAIAKSQTISAIRGYDYQGIRDSLVSSGFQFVNLNTGEAASRLFFKERTSHLLTYLQPYRYYISKSHFSLPKRIEVQGLFEIDTFYGVVNSGEWKWELIDALTLYANKHNLARFTPVETLL